MGGVAKSFRSAKGDEQTVLSQVDIDITAGEFVCLVGPIGCGKTTLINLLAGFEHPSEGLLEGDLPGTTGGADGPLPRAHPEDSEYISSRTEGTYRGRFRPDPTGTV